jgi:hypothetical protein
MNHAGDLRKALLEAALNEDATPLEPDVYGRRYVIDFMVNGSLGNAMVRSSWIVRRGEDFARLTSCFVL